MIRVASLVTIAAVLSFGVRPAVAQDDITEFMAQSIRVLGDSGMMHRQRDYWITSVTWQIGSKGIPETINIGDVIGVSDQKIRANYIYASRCNRRIERAGNLLCRDGQIRCMVVERPEDRPSDDVRNRLWVQVANCAPIQ